MNNDDQTSENWMQFRDLEANARLRNAVELFMMKGTSGLSCTSAPDRLASASPQVETLDTGGKVQAELSAPARHGPGAGVRPAGALSEDATAEIMELSRQVRLR